jgi:Flp pilus assembly pilin Flp
MQKIITFERVERYDYPETSGARVAGTSHSSLPGKPFHTVRETMGAEKQRKQGVSMKLVCRLWHEQEGQDIAEYAVMLAVILVIVVGTVRLIGSNANTVFSNVASSIQ